MRGLFDYEYQLERINKHRPPLQKLDKVIEWEMFRAPIEEALYVEPKGPGGRPSFDRVMMFKILILQRYYNLSDEQTEFQIKDRLSFMQFLGLQIGDTVPDDGVPLEGRRRSGFSRRTSKRKGFLRGCSICSPDS